jgi:hypothetical protein
VFTSLLGNLTSFLPKSFIFGSFIPVVIFGFLNGALLYCASAAFRDFARPPLATATALTTVVLFVAAVVIAYVISSLQNVMRRTLEGAYTPRWLASAPRRAEARRKASLEDERDSSRNDAVAVDDADAKLEQLKAASRRVFNRSSNYAENEAALRARVAALVARVGAWQAIHADDFNTAFAGIERALGAYDHVSGTPLFTDWQSLVSVIKYARQEAPDRERASFARREADFGDDLPASTRLGNIAGSLASYTLNRYNFDIDTFWSRLQLVLQQKDAASYGALIDAKTQLDFLVACWWFTVATAIVWVPLFVVAGDAPLAAVVAGALGVAVATAVYRLAATAYASYADFVRACVDLNRFALLRALHIALPSGIREERALWTALSQLSSFASRVVEITYQHDGGPP